MSSLDNSVRVLREVAALATTEATAPKGHAHASNVRRAMCIAAAACFSSTADRGADLYASHDLTIPTAVVQHDSTPSTIYAHGRTTVVDWFSAWHPMCGSLPHALTTEGLGAIAKAHCAEVAEEDSVRIIDTPRDGIAGESTNFVFILGSSVPAAAIPAFTIAEQYLESQFHNPIAVIIDVSFASLPSGVLGATTPIYTTVTYKNSRIGLVANADSSDTIQSLLPAQNKIKVRYSSFSTATQEDRVYWTRANYKSTIGTALGSDASMQFSTAHSWNYDPCKGVDRDVTSFVDVLIHEIGHALGCVCGAGILNKDMSSLDLFRFQYSDGDHDYNPDNAAEFTARPRLVAYNTPNDSHIVDFVTVEYRMSDGSPYQASHLREQYPSLGLMDPVLGMQYTRCPDFFSEADLAIFDAIGWDR